MSFLSNANQQIGGTTAAVAAAGNSQATGTALTAALSIVTSATATSADGVVLPSGWPVGARLTIVNKTAVALDVFPPSGGGINGAADDAAKALAANMSGEYISLGDDDWGAVLSA